MSALTKLCRALAMAALVPVAAPAQEPPAGKRELTEAELIREADALAKKYGPKLKPNAWFPVADLDLGKHFEAGTVTGTFEFANPLDRKVVWSGLKGSCTCAKAVFQVGERTYELTAKPRPNELFAIIEENGVGRRIKVDRIEIPPGAKGRVVAHLEIPAVPGPRQAYLTIRTDDEALPELMLRWRGWSARLYEITPDQVMLDDMKWNESREFTVDVASSIAPDFAITRMEGAPENLSVKWRKATRDGRPIWKIAGKFGPATSAISTAMLTFHTDVAEHPSFTVRFVARGQDPLRIEPGTFLPFGIVRRSREFTKEVTLTANDGSRLTATKLAFEELTIDEQFVRASSRQEGESLVVTITVGPQAPRGLLKGALVIGLDHGFVKQKRIEFNGFVR